MKLDKREGTFEGCYTFKVVSYLAIRTFQEVQDQVVCTWLFVFYKLAEMKLGGRKGTSGMQR